MRPDEKDAALLKDMREKCRDVLQFLEGVDVEQFVKDRRTRYAIERALEMVGEASKKVSYALRQAHQEIPWRDIAGFRDVLAHDYLDLDYRFVYATACNRVPPLLAALEAVVSGVREVRGSYRVTRRRIGVDLNGRALATLRLT